MSTSIVLLQTNKLKGGKIMKKHVRKAHAKKNHNYKNVKENKNMKNGRKMTEVENLMFTLQMQNATGDADQMKSIVHEELFYNLRTLMEVDGFDMSFMDTQPFIEALCLANKEQIEAGNDVMDWGTRQLAHATFKLYLSRVDDSFVHMVNARDWKHRMHQFVSIYVLCLSEHYADRSGWIKTLAAMAEEYKKANNENAYENTMNYLSLFVLNFPTIELTRSLSDIVQALVEEKSA